MANKRFELSKLFQTFFSKCLCKGRTATMAQDLNNVIPDSGGLQSGIPSSLLSSSFPAPCCALHMYIDDQSAATASSVDQRIAPGWS